MVFQEGDDGTLCMTSQECLDTKFSRYDEPSLKGNMRAELLGNLQ